MTFDKLRFPIALFEVAVLIDLACYGRNFQPLEVWRWLEEDEIEDLREGRLSIGHVMAALDSVQECGGQLDPVHNLPMPEPEYPSRKSKAKPSGRQSAGAPVESSGPGPVF